MPSLRERCQARGVRYVTRAEWGARAPRYRNPMPRPVDGIVWHHTVTGSAPEVAQMQAVQAFHMDGRGWSDFAYSLAVGQSGNVYEGRSAEGLTHGMLARSGGTGDPEDGHLLSCVSIGDFHTPGRDVPTTWLLNSLGVVAGWVLEELGADDQFCDRDFNLTACCGDRLYDRAPFTPIPYVPKPEPLPPAEPFLQALLEGDDDMMMVHRPGEKATEGWWLQLNSGVMIPATGNVQSVDDAVKRCGTSITKPFWNDLVEYDAVVRAKLGYTTAVKPQTV